MLKKQFSILNSLFRVKENKFQQQYFSSKSLSDYNILVIGGNNNPIPELFENNFTQHFEKQLQNNTKLKYFPRYKFVNNEQELQDALQSDFGNKTHQICLSQFGQKQVDLLLKAYENQKENVQIVHGFLVGVEKFLPHINHKMDQKVIITNAKGSFSESLAEYVIFACLFHSKKANFFQEMQKKKQWIREPINMIKNKNVAIFGFGDIGQTIGRKCQKMGMNIIACKNDPKNISKAQLEITNEVYGVQDCDKVLNRADFVVSIMPLTPETDKFFDLDKFKQMRQNAVFINIGRGQSVVESDIAIALRENIISGAFLDVFEQEPLDKKSELWEIDNLYISQHCADVTTDVWELNYNTFIKNLELHLEGKEMKNIVDRQKGY